MIISYLLRRYESYELKTDHENTLKQIILPTIFFYGVLPCFFCIFLREIPSKLAQNIQKASKLTRKLL